MSIVANILLILQKLRMRAVSSDPGIQHNNLTVSVSESSMAAAVSSSGRDFGSIRDKDDIIHLCIPIVDLSVTQEYISSKLGSLRLGIIKRVQFSPNKEAEYKKAIVYFDSWVDNEQNTRLIESLKQTGCLSIVYDFPKIWKCRIFNPNMAERIYNVSASRYVSSTTGDMASASTSASPPLSGAGTGVGAGASARTHKEADSDSIDDKCSVSSSNKSFDFSSLTPTNSRRRQYVPAPASTPTSTATAIHYTRASPPRFQYRPAWQ